MKLNKLTKECKKVRNVIKLQIHSIQLGSTRSWCFGMERTQLVETFEWARILRVKKKNSSVSSKKRIVLQLPRFENK
jgi:hypothetical protein